MSPRGRIESPSVDNDLVQLQFTRHCIQLVGNLGGVYDKRFDAKLVDHVTFRIAVRIGGSLFRGLERQPQTLLETRAPIFPGLEQAPSLAFGIRGQGPDTDRSLWFGIALARP